MFDRPNAHIISGSGNVTITMMIIYLLFNDNLVIIF